MDDVIREAILFFDAFAWGGECALLHRFHGDADGGECGGRGCHDCRNGYGRAMSDRLSAVLAGGSGDGGADARQTDDRPSDGAGEREEKVLDADGVEIHVGDTLYYVDGREQRVNTVALLTDSGRVQFGTINETGYVTYCDAACIPPNQLTHRAPVLAADGEQLREGETVWSVNTGEQLEVSGFDGDYVKCRYEGVAHGIPAHGSWHARELTHEPPDSWERIEEDAKVMANPTLEERVSLVRRCRALAGRGER